jgi:hypothetical protein
MDEECLSGNMLNHFRVDFNMIIACFKYWMRKRP